jgi:hypothetical protein
MRAARNEHEGFLPTSVSAEHVSVHKYFGWLPGNGLRGADWCENSTEDQSDVDRYAEQRQENEDMTPKSGQLRGEPTLGSIGKKPTNLRAEMCDVSHRSVQDYPNEQHDDDADRCNANSKVGASLSAQQIPCRHDGGLDGRDKGHCPPDKLSLLHPKVGEKLLLFANAHMLAHHILEFVAMPLAWLATATKWRSACTWHAPADQRRFCSKPRPSMMRGNVGAL